MAFALNPFITNKVKDADCTCDILDKNRSVKEYVITMLNRTSQMFEYDGLPETIPAEMLELYLQINGHVSVTKVKGELYALPGGFGGAPDPYYRPTLYVVANPGLGFTASLKILNFMEPFAEQDTQGECVVIRNDTVGRGLWYMFSRYATQMTENDISIRSAQINSRQQAFICADTDAEAAAAQQYIDDLVAGKLSAVSKKPFLDGIEAQNLSVQSANVIIQLIELQQYLKASWFNEIGLNANFNMKREYLSEEELRASTDVLLPLIDDMLQCRKQAVEIINKEYGTSISVEKNSAWENKQSELDTAKEQAEADVAATLGGEDFSQTKPEEEKEDGEKDSE